LNVNGAERAEQLSDGQLEDLLAMIKNAEKSKILFWNADGFYFFRHTFSVIKNCMFFFFFFFQTSFL
jgi:hypothetical protein